MLYIMLYVLYNCLCFVDVSLLPDVDYVICLDAIGLGNSLNLHVSKPPKEGSAGYALVEVRCGILKSFIKIFPVYHTR